MILFLDTEFTDLVIRPRLLSVGIASDARGSHDFYAEVDDPLRIGAACRFAQVHVLPQFGKLPGSACSYAQLGARLARYLAGCLSSLHPDSAIELAFGYHLDWDLIDAAATDSLASDWAATRRRLSPTNVYELTGFGVGNFASEAYFKAQDMAPISRHHALCDARALCVAYEAATQVRFDPHHARTSRQRTSLALDR